MAEQTPSFSLTTPLDLNPFDQEVLDSLFPLDLPDPLPLDPATQNRVTVAASPLPRSLSTIPTFGTPNTLLPQRNLASSLNVSPPSFPLWEWNASPSNNPTPIFFLLPESLVSKIETHVAEQNHYLSIFKEKNSPLHRPLSSLLILSNSLLTYMQDSISKKRDSSNSASCNVTKAVVDFFNANQNTLSLLTAYFYLPESTERNNKLTKALEKSALQTDHAYTVIKKEIWNSRKEAKTSDFFENRIRQSRTHLTPSAPPQPAAPATAQSPNKYLRYSSTTLEVSNTPLPQQRRRSQSSPTPPHPFENPPAHFNPLASESSSSSYLPTPPSPYPEAKTEAFPPTSESSSSFHKKRAADSSPSPPRSPESYSRTPKRRRTLSIALLAQPGLQKLEQEIRSIETKIKEIYNLSFQIPGELSYGKKEELSQIQGEVQGQRVERRALLEMALNEPDRLSNTYLRWLAELKLKLQKITNLKNDILERSHDDH